jgi:septin family protein
MKLKTSVKMSDENRIFWKNLNINCIKTNHLREIISYSDLQETVVKYFKLNNDRYLELIELVGKMGENQNGNR